MVSKKRASQPYLNQITIARIIVIIIIIIIIINAIFDRKKRVLGRRPILSSFSSI
jgi:hypothetical protein